MRLFLTVFLVVTNLSFVFSQGSKGQGVAFREQIEWGATTSVKISEDNRRQFLSFEGAVYDPDDNSLPRYIKKIPLSSNSRVLSAKVINAVFEPLSREEAELIKGLSIESALEVKSANYVSRKTPYSLISFIPIRKNPTTGVFEKLISFQLDVLYSVEVGAGLRSQRSYAANSILSSGEWYKIAIPSDGIYQLSYTFLKSMGIDMNKLNPKNIRIYGNGGGMLPELNSTPRPDDLNENAIFVNGENDGVFNTDDYVLFYGKGPHSWSYSSSGCPNFNHSQNLYSDSAYYFINVDIGFGKRIQNQNSTSLAVTDIVSAFDDYAFHENDQVNFIKSGRNWYGEYFENNSSASFAFTFPNIDNTNLSYVKARIASRAFSGNASYSISAQTGSASVLINPTTNDSYDNYANMGTGCFSFTPSSSTINVNITKNTSNAIAWLDYIEVNVRRQLKMSGTQMQFRDSKSVGTGKVARYNINSTIPITIWDVTDIADVKNQITTQSATNYQFTLAADNLKQFIAFVGTSYLAPSFVGQVESQNLHALSSKQYIIVTHPDFYSEAQQLAAHHETQDGISSVVVTTNQVFNEFSSGAQDICAIRDFMKMLYDRASSASELPQYLLLFGDASYDYKNRFISNTNFVPAYQSENSTLPTASYVSDDFYGLLDDGEGLWLSDAVDIGIGRFPVKNKSEAQGVLNKILLYTKTGFSPYVNSATACTDKNSATPLGNWRNTVCFIGDDEDQDLHISDAERLATIVDTTYNDYNIDKIYLDAYQQETKPGGNRYPDVMEALNKRVDQGALIINYTGHGGELGLAHERILDVAQINKWNNINKLFLFYTASCEVSRYDDPLRTSAGEYAFLNPNGAAIAMFSTVRVVYANPNFILNRDFMKSVFEPINGEMPRLGDLYMYSKTQPGGNSVNSRNFTLLGDPALTLAYPMYDVVTDSVNGNVVTSLSTDTLKALSEITICGHVKDKNGNVMTNYNGVLYPTVFDKSQNFTTLSNDGIVESPPFNFKLQKNILYNGMASVTKGYFKFSFIVPKDIVYQYGIGRISYYAQDGSTDANGYYENIVVGGSDENAVKDDIGPDINLYMNDAKFVYGGLTNQNPDLYAILKDNSGINTVGSGIGHDVIAVLDGNEENAVVLNEFYQADLNSYKSGTVRYPFTDIAAGKHTLKLKAWDVYNNSSDASTEFVVANSGKLALEHVLNYPNPFTTRTQFYFEHNRGCSTLDVQIQVFTVAGKLVKSIDKLINCETFRTDPIEWDGRDTYGDKIGRGVYVYRVKVKASDGSVAEKYEKLVILN